MQNFEDINAMFFASEIETGSLDIRNLIYSAHPSPRL